MRSLTIMAAVLASVALLPGGAAEAAELVNPSFETHNREGFVGWRSSGARASARDWCLWRGRFATRGYMKVRITIGLPASRRHGRLWIDSVWSGALKIADGDFARQKPGGGLSGAWRAVGDVTVATDLALDPGPASMIRSAAASGSSLSQVVECAPGEIAELTLRFRGESLTRPARIEIDGLSRKGEPKDTLLAGDLGRVGRGKPGGVWCARLEAGKGRSAELSTKIDLGAARNVAVSFDVRGTAGSLTAELQREAAGMDEGGRRFRAVCDVARPSWRRRQLAISPPLGGTYRLRFTVQGPGWAEIDEVRVGEPSPIPTPRSIRTTGRSKNFHVPDTLRIVVSGPAAAEAVALVRGTLEHPLEHDALVLRAGDAGARKRPRIVLSCGGDPAHRTVLDGLGVEPPRGAEAYAIRVNRSEVMLAAGSKAGLAAAVRALSWLVVRSKNGGEIAGVDISDAPGRRVRGVALRWDGAGDLDPSPERLADLRFNLLIIDTPAVYSLKDDDALRRVSAVLARARAAGLRAAVFLRCMSEAREIVSSSPASSAAVRVFDERHVLRGGAAATLDAANILRSSATRPEVWALGGTRYVEGTDYVVAEGETRYPFSSARKRWSIKRRAGGLIGDGEEVIVRYDHAVLSRGQAAQICPSEPAAQRAISERLVRAFKLPGLGGVLLGGRGLGACRCSRCTGSGLTPAKLHAAKIERLVRLASSAPRGPGRGPVAFLFSGDALNPYGPEGASGMADAIRFLPTDIKGKCLVALECPDNIGRAASYFRSHELKVISWRRVQPGGAIGSAGLPAPGVTEGIVFELPTSSDFVLEQAAEAAWAAGR